MMSWLLSIRWIVTCSTVPPTVSKAISASSSPESSSSVNAVWSSLISPQSSGSNRCSRLSHSRSVVIVILSKNCVVVTSSSQSHYIGSSTDLYRRIQEHRAGHGARLMQVVHEKEIPWVIANVFVGGKKLERQIKNRHRTRDLCSIFRCERSLEDCRTPVQPQHTP